ncbi:MAG: tRNA (adenosine(37)-N6)-threonylcarbamoyltransferase complex dimerization subunit type 1 TsaB [Anaerolineae bacterium]|nr:tRNA (adenosine(37)-N6)-threonylcarbamoyltransferase complex dimerization subunit type 1 TsaB [Anaerolineae bacterium]
MLLAIDTATRTISIAIHDGQSILAEETWRTANHHTVELTPALQHLFDRAGITPADLTALAVALGPGSYTGLRIGMSLAKGLALAASPPLPIVGIPTLDIVAAAQPHLAERLCAITQAGRGRINAAFYDWHPESGWLSDRAGDAPFICTWDELLPRFGQPTQVAGEIDAQGREKLSAVPGRVLIANGSNCLRRAGFLAESALKKLESGAETNPALLVPIYLS